MPGVDQLQATRSGAYSLHSWRSGHEAEYGRALAAHRPEMLDTKAPPPRIDPRGKRQKVRNTTAGGYTPTNDPGISPRVGLGRKKYKKWKSSHKVIKTFNLIRWAYQPGAGATGFGAMGLKKIQIKRKHFPP